MFICLPHIFPSGSVPASHALSHRSSVAYPLAQCRVLPVLVLPLELLPPRHSRLSVRPAHRLRPCREAKAELLPVSATHHTMDASITSSEMQETLRKNQEKDGAGAVSVKEPSEPQRSTMTDVHSSLPDAKKQELGTELPSRRMSLTAFPKAVEMGHGAPRIPSARPLLLEPLCPQRTQLQQLQNLSLAKATKCPPSSTENGPLTQTEPNPGQSQ
ncbi:hypothetical protein AGOR_G00111890 [Albula goreensis]|uniref:Uncharacterized protein n=1 Tax=Albula goreensis TaxID=1534307 RepID=A0A8T3DNY1_9TELE|nr:hypothetical protein AGOR_G00111890 [Albula goreensis]